MIRLLIKHPDPHGRRAGALSVTAFAMCVAIGMYFTAIPYIIMRLGGSDFAVGMSSGTAFITYILGCIIITPKVDNFNPRTLSLISVGFFVFTYAAIAWVGAYAPFGDLQGNLAAVLILVLIQGFSTALLWPPIMGWMSSGAEGPLLNQRLAIYNVSWTSGLTVGPFLAGKICETDPPFALLGSAAMAMVAGVIICSQPSSQSLESAAETEPSAGDFQYDERLALFKALAKPAMVSIFFGAAALRTQMAVLYEKQLGFSETNYGVTLALFHLANAVTFFIFSRTSRWHYRYLLHFAVQAGAAAGMVMIALTASLPALAALMMVAGAAQAYAYMANQYYSVSGAVRRARQMAIHETLLSVGCGLGPVLAGAAAIYGSRRMGPYLLAAAVTAISMVLQALYLLRVRKKNRKKSGEKVMETPINTNRASSDQDRRRF